MPTYQYACTECGHRLEAVQSFSDPALTVCPACDGRLRKVFNSVGVVFKGSGFYRTDSRTNSGSGAADKAAQNGKPGDKPAKSDSGTSSGATGTSSTPATTSASTGKSGSTGTTAP